MARIAAGRAGRRRAPRAAAAQTQLEEALFTGLRLTAGLDIEAVGRRYGADVWDRYRRGAAAFYRRPAAVPRGAAAAPDARQGMLLANEIMAVFV